MASITTHTGVGSTEADALRPLVYTPDEAGVLLGGISYDTVMKLVAAGELATTDVGTGKRARTRISRVALEEFIARRTTTRPIRAS